jgi:transcriptional regulator with XRE-family HTH domain
MNEAVDVKTLREGLGWTQEQLAEYLGLDRSSVSRIENGQKPAGPTRRLLEQLHERRDNTADAHGEVRQ